MVGAFFFGPVQNYMTATSLAVVQLHELSLLQQDVTRKTLVSEASPIEDATNEEDLEPQD